MSTAPGCILLPYVERPDLTREALRDALAQLEGAELTVLLVNHGGRQGLDLAWVRHPRVLPFDLPLPFPSLGTLWNWGLNLAWTLGCADCMVWNNDIRVAPGMYRALRQAADALGLDWISPVNCRDSGDPDLWRWSFAPLAALGPASLGGPDFSCFLIRQALHARYPFDERFEPAWFEDNDYHRRLWLGGDGARIAGVPLPYWHAGSSTLSAADAEGRGARLHAGFLRSQARYLAKWGGLPHQERRVTPDSLEDLDGVGTPGGYLAMPPPEAPATPAAPIAS